MVNRPAVPNHPDENRAKYLSVRGKFNKCLDQIIGSHSSHHVMSIQLADSSHFDSFGQLSHYGTVEYWRAFNGIFKRFDKHEISLKPASADRKKLPTPPEVTPRKSSSQPSKLFSDQKHRQCHHDRF